MVYKQIIFKINNKKKTLNNNYTKKLTMKAALTAIVLIATLSDSVEAQKKKGLSYGCKWQ